MERRHDQNVAQRATQPSESDVALAQRVILGALAAGQVSHVQNLIEQVRVRFREEPLPPLFHELDDVAEDECRAAWATAAALTALAALQWSGQIIPHDLLEVPDAPQLQLDWRDGGSQRTLRDMRPEYFFPIGKQLRLSPWLRATKPDTLGALTWPGEGVGDKVTRVLREAAESYRRGLPVAAAILIGVASEAAWVEVAMAVVERTSDPDLKSLLASERSRAAALATRTGLVLKELRKVQAFEIDRLLTEAAHLRDLRDHAVHEPAQRFDDQLFTPAKVGVLLEAAVDYFRRLHALTP